MLPELSNVPVLITGQVDNGAVRLLVPISVQLPPAPLLFVAEMMTLVPLSVMPLNFAGGGVSTTEVTFSAIQALDVSFVMVPVTPDGSETEKVPVPNPT